MLHDVSPYFKWNLIDQQIGNNLIEYEATPRAVTYFSEVCDRLTDYAYWFFLSTIWVSYSGHSDLQLWRKLFSSDRPKRRKSIMKPSEVKVFETLPYEITAYRAHREGETDWISYTLDWKIAVRFAQERGVNEITEYRLRKKYVLALFLSGNINVRFDEKKHSENVHPWWRTKYFDKDGTLIKEYGD
ncbi:hypothetical protein ABEO98_22650 [Brevibacillus parabrevis]|uniref:hypothetical protein n=1 Tax=Brevibacillus parabrevis TaxID=54914 RepID=UPI003D19DB63